MTRSDCLFFCIQNLCNTVSDWLIQKINNPIKTNDTISCACCHISVWGQRNQLSRNRSRFMVKSILGHFHLGQLAPFHWSIPSMVISHLYQTQVNSNLGIFRTFSCKKRKLSNCYGLLNCKISSEWEVLIMTRMHKNMDSKLRGTCQRLNYTC